MLCGNDVTLPPFIHLRSRPSLRKTYSNNLVALPEPLAICSSIMQMYMAKSPGNVAFIWRTIQAESQRIEDEVSIMSWKLWPLPERHSIGFTTPGTHLPPSKPWPYILFWVYWATTPSMSQMKISFHLYLAPPKSVSSLETIKNDRILIFSS
jgi:hypothetical protein